MGSFSRPPQAPRPTSFPGRAATWIAVLLLAALAAGGLRPGPAAAGDAQDSLDRQLPVFTEVLSLVRRAYVEEPDVAALFAGSFEGIADGLDPLAHYVPAAAAATFLATREAGVSGSGLRVIRDRGIPYVLAVARASPAAAAVRSGDILTRIDGDDARHLAIWQILTRLAGEPGSRLDLEILRGGEVRQVTLTLAAGEAPAAVLVEREGIPVLRPGRFDGAMVDAVRQRLGELRLAGAPRLIVDLRDLAGGDPESAYATAGSLVQGELGRLVRRGNTLRTFVGEEAPLWSGRLVVLVNRASQGPAEILAAVLAQGAGAELVGEPTFGHAGREVVRRLSGGALLCLTDAFFTGPDGANLDETIEPAVRVRGEVARGGEGETADPILERALEWIRSQPSPSREATVGR